MKKTGLLLFAIILALGCLGVGYAYWSRTLTTTANVTSGTFNPQFGTAVTDDDGTTGNLLDPTVAGTYSGSTWTVASRAVQNVGVTTALISTSAAGTTGGWTNDTLTITMGDSTHPTYPGYFATVYCTVVNNGNIPINVVDVSPAITVQSGGGATTDIGVSVSGVLTGTNAIPANSFASGYITIGIGNGFNGATTDPPTGGGTYKVTFTLTAKQFNAP
jgi:hypothetical protein